MDVKHNSRLVEQIAMGGDFKMSERGPWGGHFDFDVQHNYTKAEGLLLELLYLKNNRTLPRDWRVYRPKRKAITRRHPERLTVLLCGRIRAEDSIVGLRYFYRTSRRAVSPRLGIVLLNN